MRSLLLLAARVAKSSKSHGHHHHHSSGGSSSSNNNYANGGGEDDGLPWWADLIIAIAAFELILFIGSLLYYLRREGKRKARGETFRTGHAFWKAFCVVSGLWLPILIKRKLRSREKNSGAATTYTKVEEGQAQEPLAGQAPSGQNVDYYGLTDHGSAYAPYGENGTTDNKYEPMGYNRDGLNTLHQPPSQSSSPAPPHAGEKIGYA
ncbi:hypothetical protein F5Y18DRAFT_413412 [Xylariaceae sp. FL1019]|nr:hypothetical protein F5Y18DRAFT_413412 [Xylariaceae sp. FL1019]